MIHVIKTIERPDKILVDSFATIAPATAHEVMGRTGAMDFQIKPIYSGMRVCGPAVTVQCHPGDNSMLHVALALAQPGDVLVATMGRVDTGAWGEVLSTSALARGVGGLVIDGMVRDGLGIKGIGFPVFARGLCMKGTVKESIGLVNHPICCGSVTVSPGDIVLGDDDGVVVVPKAEATEALILRCEARETQERDIMDRLRGSDLTTLEVLGLEDKLRAKGLREEA